MRILYLVYSKQALFSTFSASGKTGFGWVDSLIDEFTDHEENVIGLAVPVEGRNLLKEERTKIILFGLPGTGRDTALYRMINRMRHLPLDLDYKTAIQKVVNDFNPDIIQVFGTENPLGEASEGNGVPVVIHFQGSLDSVARKWFSGIPLHDLVLYGSLRNLLFFRGPVHEFFTFRKRALREIRIIQNCGYFLGRTSFDRNLLFLISPGSKYFHCDEFLRPQFLVNTWKGSINKKARIISVLKGVTYKGLDLLIDTAVVLTKFTSIEVDFDICGVDAQNEIVRGLIKKNKKRLDFTRFKFLGKLESDKLVDRLCGADIFIHPSYIENSSNSICEAMALGMPVIATNVGGTSSVLLDGEEGLLVQEGDPLSMANAIISLLDNPEYACHLGSSARMRALERHNPGRLYENLIRIFSEILATSKTVS
jgi:glycosyltransferase involved in cell wall biosynthesis